MRIPKTVAIKFFICSSLRFYVHIHRELGVDLNHIVIRICVRACDVLNDVQGVVIQIDEIAWDTAQRKALVVERRPKQSRGGYAISMSLPIGEKQIVQKALNAAQTMVRQASDHEDLEHKITSVIYSISRLEDTVGQEAMSLTIT